MGSGGGGETRRQGDKGILTPNCTDVAVLRLYTPNCTDVAVLRLYTPNSLTVYCVAIYDTNNLSTEVWCW